MSNSTRSYKTPDQRIMQEAQLSLLRGIAEALAHNAKIEDVLEKLLVIYLEAAGIEKGVVYLFDINGKLISQQTLGCSKVDAKKLETSLGHSQILSEVFTHKINLQLPSLIFSEIINQQFLKDGELTSAVLVPMLSKTECLGALLLGSRETAVINSNMLSFAEILSQQISEALALSKAFEKILSSESRYKSLMDNASCGFLVLNQNGIILETNKEMEKIMQCTKDQLINKDFRKFVISTDRTFANETLQKISVEKIIYLSEIRFNPIGSEHPHTAEFTASEIKSNDEVLILAVINDVTERNQLRMERLLNDRLVTVGTLAAGIAHEINSPTAWILSNFSYMKKQLGIINTIFSELQKTSKEIDSNKKLKCLDEIVTNSKLENMLDNCAKVMKESIEGAERIQNIVHNLRGYARYDETEMEALDVHDVLNSALEMTAHEFKNRAQLEKNYATNLPKIFINSGKLHQVFVNIILNAAQSMPESDLAHNKITVTTSLQKNCICIDISDTGTGIAPDVLPRIFDPFYTTKPVGAGTGLGLTISREIIRHLDGEIKVKTVVGKGSTFSVCIPLKKVNAHE